MLHGDEHSGLIAVQQVLSRYQFSATERSLFVLIGNVQAAAQNKRLLPGQPDFNRIWDASAAHHAEHAIARQCLDLARQSKVFAALDLHNNTGLNPHYACVAHLRKDDLQLARMFSRKVMLFEKPDTTFGAALAKIAPTITIEAGLSGDRAGIEKMQTLIETLLQREDLPDDPIDPEELDLYTNTHCVKLRSGFDLRFAPPESLMSRNDGNIAAMMRATVTIRHDIDSFNFKEIENDICIGYVTMHPSEKTASPQTQLPVFPFDVFEDTPCSVEPHQSKFSPRSNDGSVQRRCAIEMHTDGSLHLTAGSIPSMLTPKREAVFADCFCYLMDRIQLGTI